MKCFLWHVPFQQWSTGIFSLAAVLNWMCEVGEILKVMMTLFLQSGLCSRQCWRCGQAESLHLARVEWCRCQCREMGNMNTFRAAWIKKKIKQQLFCRPLYVVCTLFMSCVCCCRLYVVFALLPVLEHPSRVWSELAVWYTELCLCVNKLVWPRVVLNVLTVLCSPPDSVP